MSELSATVRIRHDAGEILQDVSRARKVSMMRDETTILFLIFLACIGLVLAASAVSFSRARSVCSRSHHSSGFESQKRI